MFRTELSIAPATDQLSRTARVLTMGSCFADSIGSRLLTNKVDALVNPFGTVFQPLALAQLLRAAAGEDVDWQRHLVEARGRWQSYDLHGSIGAGSPVELLQHIQELVRRTGEFVRQADVVLLTLGTAWAYRLRETGQLVNNCHKQSADLFVRELLTPDEIINALAETHAYLRRINPKLRFVLTVSPVRHLKETLQLNTVSKSVLRVATHIVSDLLPGVAYFPAYELLVDDLRDYRFYAADMLHPSEVAEDYIWEKFARAYFDADFGRFRKEWASVRQSLGHRPLHAGAPEHRQFLESTLQKLEQLSLRRVEVSDELRTVRTQLAALPVPRQPEPVAEIEDGEERIDIGEGSVVSTVERSDAIPAEVARAAEATLAEAAVQPAGSESRPPRLSPEEFRAQRDRSGRSDRGRRDGRGKNRQAQPSENEQFQLSAAADEAAEALPIMPDERAESVASLEAELTELSTSASDLAADFDTTASSDQTKKKKRRSRGGAKRTARKHALRLAAEQGLTLEEAQAMADSAEPNSPAEANATQAAGQLERQKSSVIIKSVPVKRGGRREGGVPRVPLFATPTEPEIVTPVASDAELAPPALSVAPVELPEVLDSDVTSEPVASGSKSRNSRNRKKKSAARANAASSEPLLTDAPADTAVTVAPQISPVIGTAEQLSGGSTVVDAGENNSQAQEATATLPSATVEAPEAVDSTVPAAPAARSPRRSKGRAVSGARAEKPAVDTPVVPVQDASQLRTQVAAGRLTGSSASLVEPMAPLKKAAARKTSVAKAAPKVAVELTAPKADTAKAEPEQTETPKAASPKAEAPKAAVAKKSASAKAKAKSTSAAVPISEVLAATLEIAPPAPVAPTTSPKPKPASRAKAPASKAATKVVPEAAAPKATPKAAKPKATTAKAATPKSATKPKPPKKPAKPA